MLSNVKSTFSATTINRIRSIFANYWRRVAATSVALLGLALFLLAEYALGGMITDNKYFMATGALIAIAVLCVTIGYPFWGYAIWFVMSCYLSLFVAVLPASLNFDFIMLGLLTCILILRSLARKELFVKFTIEEVFLVLYYIYGYIIRFQFDTSHVIAVSKYLFVSPLFFYFIARSIIREKKHLYWLVIIIIITGFSWALMGIYEQIVQKMWLAGIMGGDKGLYAGIRSAGPAGFYYLYGNMLIITVLLCLHVLRWIPNFYSKLIIIAVCLTSAIGLYFGYSRAPYVAFAMSLIIMLFLAKYTKRIYAVSIASLIFVAFLIVPYVSSNNILTNRFTSSITGRQNVTITSIRMFEANYLFGVGTGKYRISVPKYVQHGHGVSINEITGLRNEYTTAHSEYFLKLCELGIIGFILYFGTYALFLRRIIKVRAKLSRKDIFGYDFASLAFAFMLGVLFTMLTDQFDINQFMYAIIFTVFAMVKKAEFLADNQAIEPA